MLLCENLVLYDILRRSLHERWIRNVLVPSPNRDEYCVSGVTKIAKLTHISLPCISYTFPTFSMWMSKFNRCIERLNSKKLQRQVGNASTRKTLITSVCYYSPLIAASEQQQPAVAHVKYNKNACVLPIFLNAGNDVWMESTGVVNGEKYEYSWTLDITILQNFTEIQY